MVAGRDSKQGIIPITIRDKAALYSAYMPFIKNGGLFIPTDKPYKLGEEVFIVLTISLSTGKDKLPIAGQVVWITPKGVQNYRMIGIGVQFSTIDNGATKHKIENELVVALNSENPTNTM